MGGGARRRDRQDPRRHRRAWRVVGGGDRLGAEHQRGGLPRRSPVPRPAPEPCRRPVLVAARRHPRRFPDRRRQESQQRRPAAPRRARCRHREAARAARSGDIRVLVLVRSDLTGPFGDAFVEALGDAVDFIVALSTRTSRVPRRSPTPCCRSAASPRPTARSSTAAASSASASRFRRRCRHGRVGAYSASSCTISAGRPCRSMRARCSPSWRRRTPFKHLSYARLGDLGQPLEGAPSQ